MEKPDRTHTLTLATCDGEDGPGEHVAQTSVERLVLTAEQVAQMLGVTPNWVRMRGKSGVDGFPRSFSLAPGNTSKPVIRFRREEVLDYVDRCQGIAPRRS